MNYLSLLVPVLYISILLGSMSTFSYLYRRRQAHSKLSLSPYFPAHTARDIYLTLLHTDPKPPDVKLRAALLIRATEDVRRILEIRSKKPAAQQCLQRGVIGDEVWQRIVRAEQELEAELKDVVNEANALSQGWGGWIFQSAGEMVQNEALRGKLREVRESVAGEKLKYEREREMARRELEGEGQTLVPQGQQVAAETTEGSAQVVATAKTGSSDEDVVMVETPGVDGQPGGGGGKNKKKKGKK